MTTRLPVIAVIVAVLMVVSLVVGFASMKTIPAGHVGVATLFGDVAETTYTEGLNFPVNPLYAWDTFDIRQKNLDLRGVTVPTEDQQTSMIDLSVIYFINGATAPTAKSTVGLAEDIVSVKLSPNLRSLVRSEGKAVKRCEELFSESVQATMQTNLQERLQERVGEYATITSVLIRNIQLPSHILDAIKNKKIREQAAEEQKAELRRFETEMEQKGVQAAAEKNAATEKAGQVKILADAQAYEIEAINKALADSPAYIKLQALETLTQISKDPATKIYFMDGNSSMPLPLLHMGETTTTK